MKLFIFARFHAREGQEDALEALLRAQLEPVRAELPQALLVREQDGPVQPGAVGAHEPHAKGSVRWLRRCRRPW